MKIAFLPIDNRPVCYTLPELITQIDSDIKLYIPNRDYLGDLKNDANIEALFDWLKALPKDLDSIILSLDTITYGGLIPSRRCNADFEEIKNRTEKLKAILIEKNCKILAFSSIMRISNNNVNEEEKEYWSEYGKKIFQYSYELEKTGIPPQTDIPKNILEDYLNTRKRNFEINKIFLNWQKEGLFDTLIFSKDDCAKHGLNIKEAKELEALGGYTKTGADEIPLSLLSRAVSGTLKIYPYFLESQYKNLVSNYEDVSVENCVKGQIELAGCTIAQESDADIILYINNFIDRQGEIVMNIDTTPFDKNFTPPDKPYMIADIRFANGSDNNFISELFKSKLNTNNFHGYSGWNTSANTLGSLICGAKIKYFAKKYNKDAFKKLQITRFLDDWAYQANIRQNLRSLDKEELTLDMKQFENIIVQQFNLNYININYKFPWNRLFEVEIEFN